MQPMFDLKFVYDMCADVAATLTYGIGREIRFRTIRLSQSAGAENSHIERKGHKGHKGHKKSDALISYVFYVFFVATLQVTPTSGNVSAIGVGFCRTMSSKPQVTFGVTRQTRAELP